MKNKIVLFLFILCSVNLIAQPDSLEAFSDTLEGTSEAFTTDKEAKIAVYNITRYSGLTPNFIIVQADDIPNANAYTKGKKRYIKYNNEFLKRVQDSTTTDWAAISVLAHEIGHHLLGHTLKNQESNPGDELAADKYSGFILYQMGATLEEAKEAMELEGSITGTIHHPPKSARLQAIMEGWKEAKALRGTNAIEELNKNDGLVETFKYKLTFKGDENTYYANIKNEIVWYSNIGVPIPIGKLTKATNKNFVWDYYYNAIHYSIDSRGTIWHIPAHDIVFAVGSAEVLGK